MRPSAAGGAAAAGGGAVAALLAAVHAVDFVLGLRPNPDPLDPRAKGRVRAWSAPSKARRQFAQLRDTGPRAAVYFFLQGRVGEWVSCRRTNHWVARYK
eukprot:gene4489-2195_t